MYLILSLNKLSRMLIIESWIIMVRDGPDCCRRGRRIHAARRVYSGRRALVQLVTRVEGPPKQCSNNSFVLVSHLYNNLLCILQNPDRILKKV